MRKRNRRISKVLLVLMCGIMLASLEKTVSAVSNPHQLVNLVTVSTSSQTNASLQLTMGGKRIEGTLDAANAATNPDEAGKVLTEVATITVGSTDGYTVAVSGNANLIGEKNSNHKIPSVASAKTLGSMKNEWGYYGVLGDSEASYNPSTSFKGMSTNQQTVATGGAASSNVTKKVTLFYGARVDNTIAEDFYGNEVTLSVVAQPGTITVPITTMQDFDATACGKMEERDTLQLEDTRDRVNGTVGTGTKYWVTKLLDGNCWMSQNLALDLSTSKALTSADSDVVSSWTPGRDTTGSVTTGSATNTETYSWNLGDYVIIDPIAMTACANNNAGLSACAGQFVAVGNRTSSSNPNFYKANGDKTYTDSEYDTHYLVGNYYQWNAATAGTGGAITNANASSSICPKNWKLPTSDYYDPNNNLVSVGKGSFYYLLSQYGVASSLSGTSSVNSNTYNIALSPLFFVRGGGINPSLTSKFVVAGQNGLYWSSRAHSSATFAYALAFYPGGVDPSNGIYRYDGFSLRCLIPMS